MEGTEYKLVMQAGAVANYEFIVDGGVINFDAHGEGEGQSLTYEEGRGVMGDSGQLTPPVSGTHGWFFRNRGTEDVMVTLRTSGDYAELRKLICPPAGQERCQKLRSRPCSGREPQYAIEAWLISPWGI